MNFHNKTYVKDLSLNVSSLVKSKKFYCDFLGFKVLEESNNKVVLTLDDTTSFLTLNEVISDKKNNGLYHFAILLPSPSDLANLVVHLVNNNIRFGASDHLISLAIYFDDPDKNGIEVYVDKDSEEWLWNDELVSMDSLPLDIEKLLTFYDQKPFTKLSSRTILGHIHLHVNSIEDSKDFYINALNFDLVSEYGNRAAFISRDKYHHHIAFNTWNKPETSASNEKTLGLNHFTIKYETEEELNKAVLNIEKLGYSIKKEDNYYIVKDPSYNTIHLTK